MQVLDILLPIVNCEYLLKKITELRKSERFTIHGVQFIVTFSIFYNLHDQWTDSQW